MKKTRKVMTILTAAILLAAAVFPFASAPALAASAAPHDFMTADFAGKEAAILEALLGQWGFQYYAPDGKWTGEDTYELKLFQRWAKLPLTGKFDYLTRTALQKAYSNYGAAPIPRTKLPLEGKYIGVNAGHQLKADNAKEPVSPEAGSPKKIKTSSGTQGRYTRVPEYKVNLAVALKLRDKLEALGARVLMTRTTNNVRISNATRAKLMNDAKVDASISLHCDGNNNRSRNGLHTLIPADRGYQHGDVLTKSQLLAHMMQPAEIKATGAKDIGYSTRKDLSGFNWSSVPVCLVEMGYMTNKNEDKRLVTAAYQDKLARGLANGFIQYFEEVK